MPESGRRASRIVGVLGGMGPAATVDFYEKLTANTPAVQDQDHLRVVIWSDPTVPSRQDAILSGGPDPTPWLRRGFETLVASGAEILVVPCNTVHPFLTKIVPAGVEFIHIVEVTMDAVRRAATSKSVGVLATDAALATGLYQDALAEAGFTPILPNATAQQQLTALVGRVKSTGADSTAAEHFVNLLDDLRTMGAGTVIVGCTELSAALATSGPPPGIRVIDPALELARATISAALDDSAIARPTEGTHSE